MLRPKDWEKIAEKNPGHDARQCMWKFFRVNIIWCPEEDSILLSCLVRKMRYIDIETELNQLMVKHYPKLYVDRSYN